MLAFSTMELELHALSFVVDESESVKELFSDIPLKHMTINQVPLYRYKQDAKTTVNNKLSNGKNRDIRLKQAYLNSPIDRGIISLIDARSIGNVVHTFIKGLRMDIMLEVSGSGIKFRESLSIPMRLH